MKYVITSFLVFCFFELPLAAHSAKAPDALTTWRKWNLEDPILYLLVLYSLLYFIGWRKIKPANKDHLKELRKQLMAFLAASLILVVALFSPLDLMSDKLAWAHMLQHTLIMMIAAPLMVLSKPGNMVIKTIPQQFLRNSKATHFLVKWSFKTYQFKKPLLVWLLYAFILWIWHLPRFYEAALHNETIHNLQHFLFFAGSFLFWRVLLDSHRHKLIQPMTGILYIFVSSLHAMFLGVLMALSPIPWYESYRATAVLHGFSALQDQQIAGFILWMPAGLSYAVGAILLLLRLFRKPNKSA